jgi:hypothetical protein
MTEVGVFLLVPRLDRWLVVETRGEEVVRRKVVDGEQEARKLADAWREQ